MTGAPPVDERGSTPPNGSRYVSARGDDQNGDGSMSRPWATVQYAHDQGAAHVTLRAGRFDQQVAQRYQRPLTVAAAPGEPVVLSGSVTVPGDVWTFDTVTGMWWMPFEPLDHTPNSVDLNDECGWATWCEQVWFDDVPLVMCDPAVWPLPGEFRVDPGLRRLWVGADPGPYRVEVSVLSWAVMGNPAGAPARLDLYGVDVVRYATRSKDLAAVHLFGPGSTVAQCVVDGCSAAGVSLRGDRQVVADSTLRRNGQLGGHGHLADNALVANCEIVGNNRKGIARVTAAGAFKLTFCVDAVFAGNRLAANRGHGLWADLSSHRCAWVANDVEGGSTGCFAELSDDCLMVGNRASNARIGFHASGSNRLELTHNTARDCTDAWFIRDDDRRVEATGGHLVAGNDHDGGCQDPVVPSSRAAVLLGLDPGQADRPHAGWYSDTVEPEPEPVPVEPEPEPGPGPGPVEPVVPSVSELVNVVGVAVAALADRAVAAEAERDATAGRLVDEQARSLRFALDLMAEAKAHAATRDLLAQAQDST